MSKNDEDYHETLKKNRIIENISKVIPLAYRDIISDKLRHEDLEKSLFLYGGPGSGKTTLACTIAKAHIAIEKPVMYHSYPMLIMKLQDAYRKETESPFDMAQRIARFSGLLILDDFGAEKLTEYVRQITYCIINEREQWRLQTIITSNFSPVQLEDQIDQRIGSRIAGMFTVVSLKGSDRRFDKKKVKK